MTKKKQHYVAQNYLKRFSVNRRDEQIYVYIRKTGEIKLNAIRDVGQAKYFYDSEFDEFMPKPGKHALENHFSEFEGVFPQILDSLEKGVPLGTDFSKETFSYFMFLNWIRSKYWRKYLERNKEDFGLSSSGMHFAAMAMPDLRDLFMEKIKSRIPIRLKTRSEIPFITSDNPVIVSPIPSDVADFVNMTGEDLGELLDRVSYMLPLSPNTLLYLPSERDIQIKDKTSISTNSDFLTRYVSDLASFSTEQIYSSVPDGLLNIVGRGMKIFDGKVNDQ